MKVERLSIAIAVMLFTAVAAAQNPPGQESAPPAQPNPSAQQTQQPEANDPTSTQVAPAEPKSMPLPQSGPAFVNGALAAPGANPDGQTVPSKYSTKNDAADHLPVLAYTFKDLGDQPKREIYAAAIGAKPSANTLPDPDLYAAAGVQLPGPIELRALPESVTAAMPETTGFRYAIINQKVLLVEPNNRTVVLVLGPS
jgi:Protein of unknown function (DUF1236)